jgi:kumamolisin
MTASPPQINLDSLEAIHERLGQCLSFLNPGADHNGVGSLTRHKVKTSKLTCRNYIKFASPKGARPHAGAPFRIANLCAAYKFPTGLPAGATIGILELGGGWKQSDLDLFSHNNGLPRIIPEDVSVNGGTNSPGGDADVEVLLDIQVAAAAYFYATGKLPTIKMFWAPNADASFAAVMNAAASAGCDVLSISWGADEGAWDPTTAKQTETAAEQATAKGCTIFAASGDNSSSDRDPGANVDMPSSCPHIIGCGGTTKTPFSEVVWGNGIPNGEGTGGGYSSVFYPTPSWQIGVPPTGGSRMVPDVAADADPETGYIIVVNGEEMPVGGTSAVAPLYAGLFAALGKKLGFVTPKLYENPQAFVDITQGSNGSFQAARGPDPCTGLGVPDGKALAALFGTHH